MLNKQTLTINFAQGLDTKTDPFQVSPGRFLSLENSIFTKGALLQKRDGFGQLTSLPNANSVFATTFSDNLLAIGDSVQAYIAGSKQWVDKGYILPVELATESLISSNTNQSQMDCAIAPNGLICTVFTDNVPSMGSIVQQYKYVIADVNTGQNIVAPTQIPVTSGTVTGSPRVFLLGRYFIIVFSNIISATDHLQYVSIPINNPTAISTNINISSSYVISDSPNFDGAVVNNSLYLAWVGADAGGSIRMTYIDSTLVQHGTVETATAHVNNEVSICADTSGSTAVIYVSFFDSISTTGYIMAVSPILVSILAPTEIINGVPVLSLTSAAQNGSCTVLYEVINNPNYNSSVPADYVKKVNVTAGGTVGSTSVLLRGVGLGSKAFVVDSDIYCLFIYSSSYQPTYFLADINGNVICKLAYENGSQNYYSMGLPNATVNGSQVQIPYLYADLIQAVNKTQGVANSAGIYSQTGINLATFTLGVTGLATAEIGKDLHISGGFLWMYDGYVPVEHQFHLWPDYVNASGSATSGGMLAQAYFYVATYEWSDNQGNIFRSAPSIPVEVNLASTSPTGITFHSVFSAGVSSITVSSASGLFVGQVITDTTTSSNIATGTYITSIVGTTVGLSQPTVGASASSPGDALKTVTTCSATIYVPTLRLTYKIANPVKIVLYRWSTAQQTYYQTTSITLPVLNDTTVDYVTIVDTNADSSIIGNNILYTTGGVVEDIAAPATSILTLFQTRLFLVDAEDNNLLWFSKQVIENTPVEMSDLLTIYVAPTIGSQGSTGGITALSAMDDKLIIFKNNAIYFINGQGPDNTGANSQFSDPTFITATVGCDNQNSIVFMPNGLMFQSDKGIWLLGRDLSTSYIGAPVEAFTQSATVLSALAIPGTNQVRFTLDSGITLMYDYYYGQWGTFTNIPAISSTLYENLHTYINDLGQVYQETPGSYLDGTKPVLMAFTTSWFNLAGLQGFQRLYFFYMLGVYYSPHRLVMSLAYDYDSQPTQAITINPTNYSTPYGEDPLWGSTPTWGGQNNLEQWRLFPERQKCNSFQISAQEYYDPSQGAQAGAGLTISGLDLVVGMKKGYKPKTAAHSAG